MDERTIDKLCDMRETLAALGAAPSREYALDVLSKVPNEDRQLVQLMFVLSDMKSDWEDDMRDLEETDREVADLLRSALNIEGEEEPTTTVDEPIRRYLGLSVVNVGTADSAYKPQQASKPPAADALQDRLDSMLTAAYEIEPVEDGMSHPAERILEDALSVDESSVLSLVHGLCTNETRSVFAAYTLRCLGRLTSPGSSEWRASVVADALASVDVELRDAAIQATESWGDRNLVQVLRSHEDAEPWLREYVKDVVEYLGA